MNKPNPSIHEIHIEAIRLSSNRRRNTDELRAQVEAHLTRMMAANAVPVSRIPSKLTVRVSSDAPDAMSEAIHSALRQGGAKS